MSRMTDGDEGLDASYSTDLELDATTLHKILIEAGHNSDKKIIMKTCLNPFVRAGEEIMDSVKYLLR